MLGIKPEMILDLKTVRWRFVANDDEMEVEEDVNFNEPEINVNYIALDEEHHVFATVIPRSQHFLPDCVAAKGKEHATIQGFGSYQEIREDNLMMLRRIISLEVCG